MKGDGVFSEVKCECLLPPPKVTKFTFYNISSSISPKMFSVRQKYFCFEKKKVFFDGKLKMTKTFGFQNLKIPQNGQISGFGIFKFWNSNFFVIFGFPSKKVFVIQSQHTFVIGFISLLRHKEGGRGVKNIFTVCILCDWFDKTKWLIGTILWRCMTRGKI